MSREDFLKTLRNSLELSLEKDAIKEQLDYYDKYISDEINKGRTEKEVIDELGDPRLIAKTIKTVSGSDVITDSTTDNENKNDYQSNNANSNSQNRYNREFSGYVNNNNTIGCIIFGLVIFIIIYSILRFMGNLAYGVGTIAFSGPIGFLLVLALFYLFFGRGRR
ncbi:MAG: DUF1700 domain-containing protein [Lachnospiraceae bacterium]|nr:DUF1700 domain-containing protein [Lachnospiraceae bacterium]